MNDVILQVNDVSVVDVPHAAAVDALKKAGNTVTLVSIINEMFYLLLKKVKYFTVIGVFLIPERFTSTLFLFFSKIFLQKF